ncbi:hypothetical protein [Streptomyces enissocaesilis]|uniref:DUF3040 domain-containing protein n=1 Tax=Streptomyces enissocaesilis TaxID=332589 RepID=A0ABP6K5Y4_9ACTN
MDGAGLTDHERQILTGIEDVACRSDAVLDLKLRTMRCRPTPATRVLKGLRDRRRGVFLCALVALSAFLFVPAFRTSAPVLVSAFALTWTVTLLYALLMVCRWSRRMPEAGSRTQRWE